MNPRNVLQLGLFGPMNTICELLSVARALGAELTGELTSQERALLDASPTAADAAIVANYRAMIDNGCDPLGDAFCDILSSEQRRPLGATYTPKAIVESMIAWAASEIDPAAVVDPGCGSGRFLVSAGRRFSNAELVGVELDPTAALLVRAHVACAGLSGRTKIIVGDFRSAALTLPSGRTLFVGNPPYVRHHLISKEWKQWLVEIAKKRGHAASQLAGLHVHFFAAILDAAAAGDVGVLITASEWLDVNYGRVLRELMVGALGGKNIQIIEPAAEPFPGTATTATIAGFKIASSEAGIGFRRVASQNELGILQSDTFVERDRLIASKRWTQMTRSRVDRQEGFVELGELCRVHRGQVTGANRVWIDGPHSAGLPPSVLYPSVTRARELFAAGAKLVTELNLRNVIDIPVDLNELTDGDRLCVEQFLIYAKAQGADAGFIASHRKAWWSVGLRTPAPILATYMARRPPAFVLNDAGARHINVAHGLYPRVELDRSQLTFLAGYLSNETSVHSGRTYSGGLTKFEPKEMERLLVPYPDIRRINEKVGTAK